VALGYDQSFVLISSASFSTSSMTFSVQNENSEGELQPLVVVV